MTDFMLDRWACGEHTVRKLHSIRPRRWQRTDASCAKRYQARLDARKNSEHQTQDGGIRTKRTTPADAYACVVTADGRSVRLELPAAVPANFDHTIDFRFSTKTILCGPREI